ncbi:PAS domain S-box protein [Desulfoluna limicola]|uniref:PAS domain S-box protein n=1 Tax=Desulfoluna limicola TaxID=2810562 RepID=UPI001F1F0766|nr:PAS domain S-box protein [Desulfoluna limicola]
MVRFKSSIGVQLTVTLSIVLLIFAVVFAVFTTRHVQQFGDSFSEQTVSTLRHRVEVNLADRINIRALYFDHLFQGIADNSARLAEKAGHVLFDTSRDSTPCPVIPPLAPLSSNVHVGSFDSTVMVVRLLDAGTPLDPAARDRLACLYPYLDMMGQASSSASAAYVATTDGFIEYYSNTVVKKHFSNLTMPILQECAWFAGAAPEENPSQSTVWTPIYADSLGGGLVVTASTPIVSEEGAFKGVAGIDMSLDGLFEEILHEEGVMVGVDGMFWFLLDMNGVPIVFPEDKLEDFGLRGTGDKGTPRGLLESSDPRLRRYAHGLLSLDKGDVRIELGGSALLISHHVLPSTGWVLGVVVPDDALLSGLEQTLLTYRQATRRMGWEIVVGAIVFIALGLGLFYYALKERLVRPLRMLANQARRVSEGDLEIKTVALSGGDEMAHLAGSFDQMIASLKEGRDFQERTTDYLETMVRSRTRDVEEKAEELHTALTELTTIFSNSMVGIMLLKGGRYLWKANDRLAQLLGYDSPEEMEGLSMQALHLSEERWKRFGTLHYEALVHGERTHIDYQMKRRDGSSVWCTLSGKAVDSSTPPDLNKGVLWMVDDITERKASEQAIRDSEERFREMAELLPCIVCEVDVAFRVTYVNSLGMKTFGLHSEDFDTPGIALKVLHPEDRQRMTGRMEIVMDGGEVEPTEFRMVRGDGTEMTALLHSTPIVKNNAVVGIRASVTDVTEYRAMQGALLKQRKLDLISSLTSGIAHDFNNMLAVMLGRVELALLSLDEKSPARVHLVTMEATLERARDLMDRLITLSTRGEGVERSVSLQDVLHRCVANAGGEAQRVALDISETVPEVTVDAMQMAKAIEYVLNNAREAYDGEGDVWVTCTSHAKGSRRHPDLSEKPFVEVAVRDEGRGIGEEHLHHILDPYYTTKERSSQKGMGLGLAVTHAVVTRHGGTLAVDSRKGRGTTVSIYLPVGSHGRKAGRL